MFLNISKYLLFSVKILKRGIIEENVKEDTIAQGRESLSKNFPMKTVPNYSKMDAHTSIRIRLI